MKSFEYAAPRTLREATSLLSEKAGSSEVLAGGTDLVTSMKQGIVAPDRLVSLKNVSELSGILERGGSLRIGATTTLEQLRSHAAVQRHFPALITAVEGVGSEQIISAGTVGGDLCQRPRCWYYRNGFGLFGEKDGTSLVKQGDNRYHSIFQTDQPPYFVSASSLGPPLIALGATLTIAGPDGKTREVAAAEFFKIPSSETDRIVDLKPNEILAEISVPLRGLKNGVYEVRHRHGFDWPYVAAAAAFRPSGSGASDAQVVLGHVAPIPWKAKAAAEALNWNPVNRQTAEKAAEAATQGAKPLSGNAYKTVLVKTAVKRAILAAAGMNEKA